MCIVLGVWRLGCQPLGVWLVESSLSNGRHDNVSIVFFFCLDAVNS